MSTLLFYMNLCGYLLDKNLQDQEVEIQLLPNALDNEEVIRLAIERQLQCSQADIKAFRVIKRSLDARKKRIIYRVRLLVNPSDLDVLQEAYVRELMPKSMSNAAIIVGFGPAGMFAALELLSKGIRPIILERGSRVKQRRRDVVRIYKERFVDPESNYSFGEGGAGTFSDGKLYTRSKKRGSIARILQTLVVHGASEEILYDARPHIGTNKLPAIVENIRKTIEDAGGEVHFNTKVNEFILGADRIEGVRSGDKEWRASAVILATGHSARDIFTLLEKQGIEIEAKQFALGVRIEHPQDLIDKIQYKCLSRDTNLPPAAYSIVKQVNGRGVFSFCMCPGGIIAPAMTNSNEVVVNGWSPSKRNGDFANSGFVVQVEARDWSDVSGPEALKAMEFQGLIEQKAFEVAGSDLSAPAQRVEDFLRGKESISNIETSYIPGVRNVNLDEVLPKAFANRMKEALVHFGKIMPGYAGKNAVLVGVESRTSSPVRIPRDKESLQHPQFSNFYPCGEGAGYAGGIMSAALDGIACATALAESIAVN
jgi:uncharacterized FAD-dependent dehydrogenase